MKDRLSNIFLEQRDFNLYFMPKKMTLKQREQWTEKYFAKTVVELTEVYTLTRFKDHKKYINCNVDVAKIREELIDVTKYVMNMMHIWGMDDKLFFSEFFRKSAINRKRFLKNRRQHK